MDQKLVDQAREEYSVMKKALEEAKKQLSKLGDNASFADKELISNTEDALQELEDSVQAAYEFEHGL